MDEAVCPSCGTPGRGVKTITLRSLIGQEKQAVIGSDHYFFCGTMGCETVYFSHGQQFSREDLTVRVGIKEAASPRPVCYCFDHSVEEIFDEVERTGKSTVAAGIRKRMAAEGCSCETRNPQGTCCLGTVEGVVRDAYARFGIKAGAPEKEGGEKSCCGPDGCCR